MPDCTTSVLFFFVNPTGKPTDNEVGWVAKPAWTCWLKEKNCQRIILFKLRYVPISFGGTWWRSWLRHCATRRKAAGSIPDDVIGIFHWHNPSGHTVALGLTQPLTEMSTRNTSWGGNGGRCVWLTTLPPSCARFSWNLGASNSWNPQGCPGL